MFPKLRKSYFCGCFPLPSQASTSPPSSVGSSLWIAAVAQRGQKSLMLCFSAPTNLLQANRPFFPGWKSRPTPPRQGGTTKPAVTCHCCYYYCSMQLHFIGQVVLQASPQPEDPGGGGGGRLGLLWGGGGGVPHQGMGRAGGKKNEPEKVKMVENGIFPDGGFRLGPMPLGPSRGRGWRGFRVWAGWVGGSAA